MSQPLVPAVPSGHEDPTQPDPAAQGRVVVVTFNHIAAAVVAIAEVVRRPTVVLDEREGAPDPVAWLSDNPLGPDDALVVCDHDAAAVHDILRDALRGDTGYVAMMGSRNRARGVFAALRDEGFDDDTLSRLRVPAGLDIGGKAPGEIALSVVAEIVASSYGRDGGPMKRGLS